MERTFTAEACHSLFKAEVARNRRSWKSLAEDVGWFNHLRLHGEIGLIPSAEFGDNFYQQESLSEQNEALAPSP